MDADTVGMVLPRSGPLDAIGESVRQGARVAAGDLAGGGLDLRVRDGAGDPDRSRAAARSLVEAGAPVLAGPVSSDVALAVREVAEAEGVPFLPAMGGNPAVTRPGTRYTFRFSSSNRQSGVGTLRFFRSAGADRLAVVAGDFSYPHAVVDCLRANAADHGLGLGSVAFTPLGTAEFGPLVAGIGAGVDGVFLPYPGNNAVGLVRELRAAGVADRATVLGDYSYGSAPYGERLGAAAPGLHNWGVDTDGERFRALAAAVADRYDRSAGVYHAFGADLVGLLDAARSRAAFAPEPLRDALAGLEYEAVAGWEVAFDEHGRNDRYRLVVNRWAGGGDRPENRTVFRSDPIAPERPDGG